MKKPPYSTLLFALLLPSTLASLLGADLQAPMPMPSPLKTPVGVNSAVYPAPRLDWLERVKLNNDTAVKMTGKIQLVFDGDSITDWWKKPSTGTRDSGPQIWNERYAKFGAFDFAIAGDRTQNLLWRLSQGQMNGIHPRLIVLMIGTNNLGNNTDEEIAAGIQAILAEYRRLCPSAVILLQGIFPRGAEATNSLRARIKNINRIIAGYADGKKVLFLDFGDKFLQPDGSLSTEIMPDFLHPNGNGYRIWADAIQPVIDKTFPAATTSATPTAMPSTIPKTTPGTISVTCTQGPGLTVKDGQFFLHGKPYRGVGANYYDLFQRVLKNPVDHSSLEGLDALAKAGVPFVRFAGPYGAKDWQHYLSDKEGFFMAMDQVVKKAEESGIGLIPSLLWEPTLNEIVGEHKDAWGDPKSRTMGLMRAFVTDVVTRYKNSPAIWAWEMGNEWNLKVDLPNAPERRKPGQTERDDLTSREVIVLNSEFCSTIRAVDSARPIITGDSHPRSDAWHNTHENNWHKDSLDQWKEILLRDIIASTDTLGIHLYADEDPKSHLADWTTGYSDYISHLKEAAQEKKVPIFIGEFGLAEDPKLTQPQLKERFSGLLNAIVQGGVDLSAVWVYDFPGQRNTWDITFTNPRAYMLEEVIAANKRLNGK